MSKSFDPYLEWLKIPADKRPPTYYALLGVEDFEEDLDKIEESFQELYSKVRRYQVGDHSADAIRILTEMSRAYDCLTSPHHKKKYDREIGGDRDDVVDLAPKESTLDAPPPANKPGKRAVVEVIDDEPLTSGVATLQVLGAADPSLPTATLAGAAPAAAPAPSKPAPGAYETVWYIQTPDGRRLGPATQQQLDEVVAHRRINPQSMVWRVGWPEAKPVVQMFPELRAAAGPGSVGPYQKLQVRPEVAQSRKAIFVVVVLLGVVAAGLGLFYGFAFTLNFMLMAMVGGVGALALAAGLMEMTALLNSPLCSAYRRRLGDESTRKLFAWVGGMCVLVSFGMIAWQASRYMSSGVRRMSRNISNLPTVPNFNVPGGGNSNASIDRPGGPPPGSFRPPPRSFPNRSGNASTNRSRGGTNVVSANGPQPHIRSFSTYQLTEGAKLTISGSGFSGTTKVVFAAPGNAKSSRSALEAKFDIVNDRTLTVTAPLQLRFAREWVCEVHSNGGVALSIPPSTRTVSGNGHISPNSIVRLAPGASASSINNCIAILEGDNKFTVMLFTRAYVLGNVQLQRGCNANVLIGPSSSIQQASRSNTKTIIGGVSVFQQPQPFSVR